jgi:hypothetical protein
VSLRSSFAILRAIRSSCFSFRIRRHLAPSNGFYERAGLKVEGRTINIGAEQSALDNVSDPCVDVVPMKSPAARPHIELLHYRGIMSSGSFEFAANAVCATRVVWHSDRDALIRDPDGHYQQLAIMKGRG